jgi:hypothetical protein
MENRSGLVVAATATKATAMAGRKAAEKMIMRHSPHPLARFRQRAIAISAPARHCV